MRRRSKIIIGVSPIVAIVAMNLGAIWWSERQVANELARIRAAGGPVTVAELRSQVEATNSTVPRANEHLMRALPIARQIVAAEIAARQFPDWTPLTVEQVEFLQEIEPLMNELWPHVQKAAAEPNYRTLTLINDRGTDPRPILAIREILRSLNCRTLLMLHEHRQQEALATCIAEIKLVLLLRKEPATNGAILFKALLGMSLHNLWWTLLAYQPTAEECAELDDLLATADQELSLRVPLSQDRVYVLLLMEERYGSMLQVMHNHYLLGHLRIIQEAIDHCDRPLNSLATWGKLTPIAQSPSKTLIFGEEQNLKVNCYRRLRFTATTRARLRAVRTLNAIRRFERSAGHEPSALAELGLSPASTADPFDGGQLTLRKTEAGWLIYAVGENFIDDGGQVLGDALDSGFGPITAFDSAPKPAATAAP